MRDFGFGVLQTAPLRSSSPGPLFCGEAYGPYAVGSVNPLPSATPFGPLSPPPLPVTGFLEAASPFSVPLGGGAGSPAAAASSSSPFLAHQQTMQDELLLGLTQQPARPLSGAAATEKLPDHHPGGGTIAGVTHLLPSQDFKPSLHHPSSSSASSCCCCRTSSPQDFSKRQQQQLSSQKRKEFSPPHLPHPPDSKPPPPPPPLHCPGRFSPPPPPAGPLLQPAQLAQRQQQQPPQQFSLLHQQHLSPQDFAPRQRPADLPPLPQLPPSPPAAPRRRHGGAGSPRKTPAAGEGSAAESPNAGLASSTPVNPAPGSMESPNHPLLNSPSNLLPGGALGAGAFSSLQSPDLPHPGGGGGGGGGGPPGGGGGGGSASPPPLPGFGTPWSVQTASPPPQPQQPPPTQPQQQPPPPQQPPQPQPQPPGSSATTPGGGSGGSLSAMPPPSPDSENGFYPGLPSSMNPAFFPSFSPVSPHGCTGLSVPTSGGGGGGFGGPFSATAVPPPPPPAMNIPQQQPPPPAAPQQPQSRRSPVSPQLQQQHQAAAAAFLQQRNSYNHHQPLLKQSPWSNHQSSGWGTGSMSWGAMHGRDHRRTGNMGIPGTMNQISPLKKPFSGNVIAPPKFTRSTPSLTPKSWIEDNVFRTDNNSNTLLPLQDRSRMYDSLNMHSLENSLIDIMRAEHDPLKGRLSYPHPGTDNLLMLNARSYGRRRGRSSLFPIDDGLLDDGHSDQVGVLNSPTCYSAHQNGERIERFSRKVFVGGLPPDIDEDEITASFRRFGPLVVDWPHKAESKSYFPPKGYAFLLFQEESSVQALIDACIEEDGKLYLCVSSPTIKDKPVQIRPWNLSDSDFVMDGSQPLDPRKTIFVGGVPRPLRAVELAMIMDRLYGGVCYAGIDTDPELKYPKGAGRVAFSNQQSYIAAISARFVQLQHGDIDKRVEVKPYVLDDQMCDECQGARCGGKFAPFFCANVTCLQYYCEFCWANIHSRAGREFHKPLVKEGADRPRQIHFRWN
ncbi:cytoplasmic polyadenylation element binding protein 2 [Homo sapiens]|uniref:Cytoplasmic polyadenylation element binding protein 2 n=2 Tax=Homo sapiens TaxID=9606 RepID=A0A5K1VW71_HUMAN|nr:cytoplasmic polyadenylation element-binding protein 2 isoform E [Homo sapiens]KAI4024893.1 cytoplasmic polyadenylation element binding protein 2 [Homo sapiens]|eukprot:NP_001170854.1 cytoplasmic polyadenylation element-binding protein 2 isoform E [Homo sapiens]